MRVIVLLTALTIAGCSRGSDCVSMCGAQLHGQNECEEFQAAETRLITSLTGVPRLDPSPLGNGYFRIGDPLTSALVCKRLEEFSFIIDDTIYRPFPPDGEIIIRLDISSIRPRECASVVKARAIDWTKAGYYVEATRAVDLCLDPLLISWPDRGVVEALSNSFK